jgi:hypothetical protein
MRPTTDQILVSLSHSLAEYVIPHIADDYGTYVAKVMRHVIEHLRVRNRLEGTHLAQENAELIALLDDLGPAPAAVQRTATAATSLTTPSDVTFIPVGDLVETNARLRAALVETIEALDRDASEFGDRTAQDDLRGRILAHMHAQARRDGIVAEPTFLSFAPKETA